MAKSCVCVCCNRSYTSFPGRLPCRESVNGGTSVRGSHRFPLSVSSSGVQCMYFSLLTLAATHL